MKGAPSADSSQINFNFPNYFLSTNRFPLIKMKAVFALTLMGLMAVAFAAGPNMSDGTLKECEVSFKCYGKCAHGDEAGDGLEHRKCFFDCLKKRNNDRVSRDFTDDIKDVYRWCKTVQRDSDASESKILKCTLKKVKKDACRWYFRDQKLVDEDVAEVVDELL